MVGHMLCFFQGAAFLQVVGDAGGTKSVIANPSPNSGRPRVLLNHSVCVLVPQSVPGQGSAPTTSRSCRYCRGTELHGTKTIGILRRNGAGALRSHPTAQKSGRCANNPQACLDRPDEPHSS